MLTPDLDQQAATDLLAALGEPVTRPDGRIVQGVFDPVGQAPGVWGSEVGLTARWSGQANPLLDLLDADVADLSVGQTVTVRGGVYHITRLAPDGAGFTRVDLMPAGLSGAAEGAPWQ